MNIVFASPYFVAYDFLDDELETKPAVPVEVWRDPLSPVPDYMAAVRAMCGVSS